jgi:hydrogenase maturation protease
MSAVLVAGIGNIFKGDDGFGVAVAQLLAGRSLPPEIRVVDFGIRGLDLVYALLDGYDAAILVDVVERGAMPGTISIIEPALPAAAGEPEPVALSPHALDPQSVLRLAAQIGDPCRRVLLVGCEPESFGEDDFGSMELSPGVAAAVGPAADAVERLALDLAREFLEECR